MPRQNRRKSHYKPHYKWGGNTMLWASETEQNIIQNSQNQLKSESKTDLEKDINYGKRINYFH